MSSQIRKDGDSLPRAETLHETAKKSCRKPLLLEKKTLLQPPKILPLIPQIEAIEDILIWEMFEAGTICVLCRSHSFVIQL